MKLVLKTYKGDILSRVEQKEPLSKRYLIERESGEVIQLNCYHYGPHQAEAILRFYLDNLDYIQVVLTIFVSLYIILLLKYMVL